MQSSNVTAWTEKLDKRHGSRWKLTRLLDSPESESAIRLPANSCLELHDRALYLGAITPVMQMLAPITGRPEIPRSISNVRHTLQTPDSALEGRPDNTDHEILREIEGRYTNIAGSTSATRSTRLALMREARSNKHFIYARTAMPSIWRDVSTYLQNLARRHSHQYIPADSPAFKTVAEIYDAFDDLLYAHTLTLVQRLAHALNVTNENEMDNITQYEQGIRYQAGSVAISKGVTPPIVQSAYSENDETEAVFIHGGGLDDKLLLGHPPEGSYILTGPARKISEDAALSSISAPSARSFRAQVSGLNRDPRLTPECYYTTAELRRWSRFAGPEPNFHSMTPELWILQGETT